MDNGDVPAWLALFISVCTAVHQWRVNANSEQVRKDTESKANAQRESDQKRQRVEQILRDLEDLAALSLDYWMKPGSDSGASGVLINSKVRDISSRISRYGMFLWPSAGQDFLLFKQAVTGGAFQSVTRAAERPLSTTVRNITSTSAQLKDKLRAELDRLDMPTRY
ncbi:hypothetical protein ACLNBI_24960 [Pseudomonas guariconensis]|uniref:hypothetical protein n=1 Tax=Pseudomonas guariconensis TaxID=1288410 RepID=UPI0039E81AF4